MATLEGWSTSRGGNCISNLRPFPMPLETGHWRFSSKGTFASKWYKKDLCILQGSARLVEKPCFHSADFC